MITKLITEKDGEKGLDEAARLLKDGELVAIPTETVYGLAAKNAERDGVDIRCYRIIYDCIDEIQAAIKGMLAPKFREVQQGRAEVRQIVKISSVGNIAGCYVLSGKVTRNSKIRVVRDGVVITEDEISSLRRFKDDVKEVAQNFECGIGLAKFNDIKEGDIFEAFTIEEYRD